MSGNVEEWVQDKYQESYRKVSTDTRARVNAGSFAPNNFGLYGMNGDVNKWVQEKFRESYITAPTDGRAWEAGVNDARRVRRGGSWGSAPHNLRSADRAWSAPYDSNFFTGFHIARSY